MKRLAFLFVLLIFCQSVEAGVIFSDDFEDGTLNKWTINGRQEGTNIADVVTRHSSQMAYLYHRNVSEITIEKKFNYNLSLNFQFDMEVEVSSGFGPEDDDYSAGGVFFDFLDSSDNGLGRVEYIVSSSSDRFTTFNPNPEKEYFRLEEGLGLVSYDFDITDVVSNITIDMGELSFVNFGFWSYGSGIYDSLEAETWVDNVVVTPEPGTLCLMISGGLVMFLKRRK